MKRPWWPDWTFLYGPLRDTVFYLVFGAVIGFGLIECNEQRGQSEADKIKPLNELRKEYEG